MIIIPAQFKKFYTNVDGATNITVETNKLNNEQAAFVYDAAQRQLFGYFAFKPDKNLNADELDVLKKLETDLEPGSKSKSQRLRAVLYRSWELNKRGYEIFDDFYNFRMEKLITLIKNKELK